MRKLTFGMNLSLDGYIAAPGDDLGWSVPSDELFQWWSDQVAATRLALYGRKLWETMSSHWPTADQQHGATPAQIEFARRWRDMPKVVFSSTTSAVDWNARLVTGDAVAEITRLKTEDGRGEVDDRVDSGGWYAEVDGHLDVALAVGVDEGAGCR
jgi:dihydrofolate reductase